MKSQQDSSLGSAIKNLDLTLSLEIPLEPLGSCSSSPSISLGPESIQLGTSTQEGPISGIFTKKELQETGS
jgi:hypothetical protein